MTSNEQARLKEARKRLDQLNKTRSELIGEVKYLEGALTEKIGTCDPEEVRKWLKDKTQEVNQMEDQVETLLGKLEEVLDEIGDI